MNRAPLTLLGLLLTLNSTHAAVRVFVQSTNGLAAINYQCTAGERVRAFALDVTVDRGQIVGVTNYFRGLSSASNQGYGVFPASFRDNVIVASGTNADWSAPAYSPLAVPADDPVGTLPGLNSSGVTLEFAALWDPASSASAPPSSGTLCALQLTTTANVTVGPNLSRGGLVAAPVDVQLIPQFSGALVGPAILRTAVTNSTLTVIFQDGELESAVAIKGPWVGSGNTSGIYIEPISSAAARFFRVHLH
jgi:hypothetical protein